MNVLNNLKYCPFKREMAMFSQKFIVQTVNISKYLLLVWALDFACEDSICL